MTRAQGSDGGHAVRGHRAFWCIEDYSRTVDREDSKKRARCFPLLPDTPLSVDVTVCRYRATNIRFPLPFSARGPTTATRFLRA